MTEPTAVKREAIALYHQGVEVHRRRCLSEAVRRYKEALDLNPAREATSGEVALLVRHAPRLFTTPDEPLPLKDVAAILHPELQLMGYNFSPKYSWPDLDNPGKGIL